MRFPEVDLPTEETEVMWIGLSRTVQSLKTLCRDEGGCRVKKDAASTRYDRGTG